MKPVGRILLSGTFLAGALCIWQYCSTHAFINPILFPPPTDVFGSFLDLVLTQHLMRDVLTSVQRVLVGFLLALITGLPLGYFLGMSPPARRILSPLIQFLRPIPPIAWIPLAIVWFGVTNTLTYFITGVAAFFPIFINTLSGVDGVSSDHLAVGRCFGAGNLRIFTDIIFPSSLPQVFTGIRIGLGMAWMAIIGAEMIASISGLGYLIAVNQQMLRLDRVIMGMIIIGSIGFFMDQCILMLKHTVIRWM